MKKILAIILTFALLVGGIYYSAPEAKEVQAETTEATEKIEYTTEEYTDTSVVNTYLTDKEAPVSASNSDWLFAGWFTDKYCTTSVTAVSDDIATYHAKFVDPDVLNVKLQITKDATPDSSSVNMRMVTSVDSLDYQQVGFEVYYGKEAIQSKKYTEDVKITTVYERIVASSESGVDYNYSPKVVDTDSEYFATATLINIAKDNYGNPFYIKPYWVTYNGVRVYGTSRYMTVMEDAFSTVTTVNIPVKIADSDAYTVVDANDTESVKVANSEVYHDGIYAHLRVAKTAVMSSLTKLNVTSGTDTEKVFYRNLETEYKGTVATADKTWYTADTSATEFVIATAADLYGFAQITDTNFNQKTVYLVADIVANKGEASPTAWTPAASGGTSYNWKPINGNGSIGVKFDGQGHVIEGIHVNTAPSNNYSGLFGYTTANATIKDLSIINSYFSAGTYMGSVAGHGTGTIENVHSKVYFNNPITGGYVGGMIGRVSNGTATDIHNCWYEGTITTVGTYTGGIVGGCNRTGMSISNCLFSGIINNNKSGAPFVGGIVGGFYGMPSGATSISASVSYCLSAGKLNIADTVTTSQYIGSVIGGNSQQTAKVVMTMKNTYGTKECYSSCIGTNTNAFVDSEGNKSAPISVQVTTDNIMGLGAYHVTELDFADVWSLREGKIPSLRCFSNSKYIVTNDIKADTSWYTAETEKTEYEISDAADLYGLAILVNAGNTFEESTIKLADDIDINPGEDLTFNINNNSPKEPSVPVNEWIPIGTSDNPFKGDFDGQGHVISGVYVNKSIDDSNGVGLFGNTCNADDTTNTCDIKNFAVKNSYIKVDACKGQGGLGSIVGDGEATISNVYTNMGLYGVNSENIGGIFGRVDNGTSTKFDISNCWYEGKIVLRIGKRDTDPNELNVGGIVGYVVNADDATIEHCLFTGPINYKTSSLEASRSPRIGGFVGRNTKAVELTISDSIVGGNIVCSSANAEAKIHHIAPVMGRMSTDSVVNIAEDSLYVHCYNDYADIYGDSYNDDSTAVAVTTNAVRKEMDDWRDEGLAGLSTDYWAMSASTIPLLKSLTKYTNYQMLSEPTWNDLTNSFSQVTTALVGTEEFITQIPVPEIEVPEYSIDNKDSEGNYYGDGTGMQGGYFDGRYFYQSFVKYCYNDGDAYITHNGVNNAKNIVKIVKYDIIARKVVAESEAMDNLNHVNDITYNSKTNQLIICNSTGNTKVISILNPDTLAFIEAKRLSVDIYAIDYHANTDKYILGIGGTYKFAIANADFTQISEYYGGVESSTTYTKQNLCCDDNYVYCLYYGGKQSENKDAIYVYDWDGNFVTYIEVNFDTQEPESISIVDGALFVATGKDDKAYFYNITELNLAK